VVLTTHHMDEAETLCERVAIMDHGKILKIGSPSALVRELDQPVRISIEGGQLSLDEARALVHGAGRASGNGAAGDPAAGDRAAGDPAAGDGAMVADDGVSLSIVTSDPATVLAALADRRALAGLQVRGATLEDVFLHLTGREYRA
jgi:ABC-2 type transport system ATP-binding protein